MSLNIANYTAKINPTFIDNSAVKDITSQILNRETTNTVDLNTLDLSKFRRVDLGVDLYSPRTDAQKATQIAVRNSGLDVNLNQNFIANVQFLNSQAAQSIHKTVSKQAEAQVIVPVGEDSNVSLREVFALPKGAEVFASQNLNKDKRGSNPFSYQKPAANKKEDNNVEALSIFA